MWHGVAAAVKHQYARQYDKMLTHVWCLPDKHLPAAAAAHAECVKMPHLASMVFAGVTAIITIIVVACLVSPLGALRHVPAVGSPAAAVWASLACTGCSNCLVQQLSHAHHAQTCSGVITLG
jgi:hypothetical protein